MADINSSLAVTMGGLKGSFKRYAAAFVVFLLILTGTVITSKYLDSLYETRQRLKDASVSFVKIRKAIEDIDKVTGTMQAMLPKGYENESVEERILTSLDSLKSRFDGAEITVFQFAGNAEDFRLPITIRAPLTSYSALVAHTRYLESLKFPFFVVQKVELAASSDNTRRITQYLIAGELRLPVAGFRTAGGMEGKKVGQ